MTPTPAEKLKLGQVIDGLSLEDKQKKKLKKQYKEKLEHTVNVTTMQLNALNARIADMKSAKSLDELKGAMEKIFDAAEDMTGDSSKGEPKKKEDKKEDVPVLPDVSGNKESVDVASLKLEIENFLKIPGVANDPTAKKLIAGFTKKLNEPGVPPDTIQKMRDSLNNIRTLIQNFDIKDAQGVVDKIQNYTESHEVKTPEANVLFFTILTSHLYRLGFRLKFSNNNVVKVTTNKPELAGDAAKLETAFTGKPDVIEWMKSGLVMNTSQWSDYMMSYPAESSATVDGYIATRKKQFTASAPDVDFLASAKAGGFDIPGPQKGTYTPRGKNIFSIATSGQQLTKKFEEMGYQTPLQKVGGRAANFAELALRVAKFTFAAATVWKGAKAVWKTIFGDESAMKAAWGDFAKTAAITGAVYYGSDMARDGINNMLDAKDNPDFEKNIQALSMSTQTAGLYDGYLDLRKQTARGFGSTAEILALPFGSNIPVPQFNTMFGILCTGNDPTMGDKFLAQSVGQLGDALHNAYVTNPNGQFGGSHVGGIREFFLDMGPSGEAFYNKFFINPTTRGHAITFLTALSNYKREPSQPGLTDSVDRDQDISELFREPVKHKVETPVNFHTDIDKIKASWTAAGYEIVHLGADVVAFGGDGLHVIVNGIDQLVNLPREMWDSSSPETREILKNTLTGLGILGVGGLALSLIPGTGLWAISGKVAIAGAAGTAVYYLFDKVQGLLNSPDKLFDAILAIPGIPKGIKDTISQARAAKKNVGDIVADVQASPLYTGLPQPIQDALNSLLARLPGYVAPVPGGQPTGPSNPGGAPGETPEQYKKKIVDIATKFMKKLDTIDVEIKGEGKFLTKKDLSVAIQANYHPYGTGKDFSKSDFIFTPTPPTDTDMLELYNVLH